jgi:hypothetical protein
VRARPLPLVVVLALGCSAEPRPRPVPLIQVGPTTAPALPPAPIAASTVAADAGYSKETPGHEAQRKRLAAYTKARARGKELLAGGDAQAAIAAFDEAREAIPYDVAVLDDEGTAELAAGRVDQARTALVLARTFVENDAFGAQVWLHLGMVEERAGAAEEARAAYAMSLWIAPSAEATAKLAGRSRCTASIQTRPAPAMELARWSLLEKAGIHSPGPCDQPCVMYVPAEYDSQKLMLFVPRGPGVLVWPDLGEMTSDRCPRGARGDLVAKSTPLHVAIDANAPELWSLCQDAEDHDVPCTSPLADPEKLLRGCFGHYTTHVDRFFDARAKRQVLSVVQLVYDPLGDEDKPPPIAVTVDGGAVRIEGRGCDEAIPLASLGKP